MRTRSTTNQAIRKDQQKQVNVRLELAMYHALEALARQERRSVSQTARQLMEEGLQRRLGHGAMADDTSSQEIAALAVAGGAFDWLAEEPDLYDDTSGEPL